jgi:hypothetical protein
MAFLPKISRVINKRCFKQDSRLTIKTVLSRMTYQVDYIQDWSRPISRTVHGD